MKSLHVPGAASLSQIFRLLLLTAVCTTSSFAMAQDDMPEGDADMPEGDDDDDVIEDEPVPAKTPEKRPDDSASRRRVPAESVDDDILVPADDDELAPRKAPPTEEAPRARIREPDDDGRTRRMILDDEEPVERPTRARSRDRVPLQTEESIRFDPEEPEPSSYDPMTVGIIAGGAGLGGVVVVGALVGAAVVTGPLVLNLWQLPFGNPPTETGSIKVSPK